MEPNNSFTLLDKYQIPVVEASHGYHLVLASPGCGKTHILAERKGCEIRGYALSYVHKPCRKGDDESYSEGCWRR